MNMFKGVKATSVEEYLASVPEERKEIIRTLHQFIIDTVPSASSYFASNMLGYGQFEYKNYKKETIDWPIIALANQKNYVSLYVCAVAKREYLAEKYAPKLGRVSVGKSCIRFKKLEDLNLDVLADLLRQAVTKPGLVS